MTLPAADEPQIIPFRSVTPYYSDVDLGTGIGYTTVIRNL